MLFTSFLSWMSIYITNNIKILFYDRIDVSEGTDVIKTSASKECDVFHYWHFLISVLSFNQMPVIDVMIYQCLWTFAILLF